MRTRNEKLPILCIKQASQHVIIPGAVSEEQFWLLIELSSIHSNKIIMALFEHLVRGSSRKDICDAHNVNNGYLSTSLKRLYRVNELVRSLSVYY
ncbi:transcriptional regulator [Escherichia coli]